MTDEYPCPDCGINFPTGRHLGGHRKTHKVDGLPKPDCYLDEKDWQRDVTSLRIEHPTMTKLTAAFVLSEACAVCPIEFMQEMQSRGRCHPPNGAQPQRDLTLGDEE